MLQRLFYVVKTHSFAIIKLICEAYLSSADILQVGKKAGIEEIVVTLYSIIFKKENSCGKNI